MRSSLRLLLISAALPVLAACASDGAPAPKTAAAAAPPAPAAPAAPTPITFSARAQDDLGVKPTLRTDLAPGGGSDSGALLAGRVAMSEGKSDTALGYLAKAPGLMDDPLVRGRAFTAALLSGDVTRAAQLAPAEAGDDAELYRLGRLTTAVEDLATGKGKEAAAVLADGSIGYPHAGAAALLAPFAAAMAGDQDGALARPALAGDRMVEVFGRVGHAQIAERLGRPAEADDDYRTLMAMRGVGALFALDYGAFLERQGRRAEALALYDGVLAKTPGDAPTLAARARAAGKKRPPPMPTFAQGAANALTGPAAYAVSDRRGQTAMGYLRLVLRLDPSRADARILVGDIAQASGDAEGARALYQSIPKGAPSYLPARAKLAWSYQNGGQKDLALKTAQETAKAWPADTDSQLTLVNILRADGQGLEAVAVLDRLIAAGGDRPSWRLLYLRANALSDAGRWPEAERDLKAALAINPNEAVLLNFLGYSWISRGENLQEGLAMVKKAAAANPHSGPMLDSLGWAYFKTGDFKGAVDTLEQAVLLEPGDPELNDHLGDAYWRVDRKDEARFQWGRVLTLEPEEGLRKEAQRKLKEGLDAPPGGEAPKVAATPDPASRP